METENEKFRNSPLPQEAEECVPQFTGALLAYVGDAVIELMIREKLVRLGGKLGEMNKVADGFARAGYQSSVVPTLLPLLSEDEEAAFRRGKNMHIGSVPKSATPLEYRKATGVEALFGYLYLSGKKERLEYLFEVAFPVGK